MAARLFSAARWFQTSLILLAGTVITVIFLLTLAVSISAWWGYQQLTAFANATQTTPLQLISTAVIGVHKSPKQTSDRINVLVLGLDSLATRGDARPLTDTILIASIDLTNGQIRAVSLPRDLWSEQQQARINTLYYYGLDAYPQSPEQLPTEVISSITGVPIHHTMVITLDQMGQLIDELGGVTVDVQTGFVDELFPRPDVDVTVERDPAVLYQTVEFKPGVQTFNGTVALQYIRSRHSGDSEGSDIARAARQQQVIAALMSTVNQPENFSNLEALATFYRFYRQYFSQYIPTTEAIAIAKNVFPYREQVSFSGNSVSIYPEDPSGVIFHPPLSAYNGQWLYVIKDETAFRTQIQRSLNQPPVLNQTQTP